MSLGRDRRATTVALVGLVLGLIPTACGTPPPGESAPPPLPAGVHAERVERVYPVHGTTVRELQESLREGRRETTSGRFQGVHSWRLRWSFRYTSRGACRMTSVQVRLRSVTVLPEWEDRERADSALVRDWDTYIGRLRAHENRHRAIAYRAAREIHRALWRVSSPTCGGISTRANARARRILDRYREQNRRYDEETDHGRGEGVVWPPTEDEEGPGVTR